MSDGGVFAVSRKLFDHPFFAPEPYTEREAWAWMIGAAAWQPKRVRVGRCMFDLDRGQLVFSERFLAEKWRWDKSRVHRFLKRLKNEAMIHALANRDATHITICNYDEHQFRGITDEPRNEPPSEALANHSRTKEEELKKDKKKENNNKGTRLDPDWQPNADDIAFAQREGVKGEVLRVEALKFRNHWTSKSGKDATKINWERAWQNWILNSKNFQRGGSPPRAKPQSMMDLLQEMQGAQHDQPSNDPGFDLDLTANRA